MSNRPRPTAQGEAQAISAVFQSVHENDPDPKLLAYQYLQTLPQLAQGAGNTFWVIPSEVTSALRSVASAFGGGDTAPEPAAGPSRPKRAAPAVPDADLAAAIDAAPTAGTVPEIPGGTNGDSEDEASRAATDSGIVPDVTDSVRAMLTAAIPGNNFGDPLSSVDPRPLPRQVRRNQGC